MESPNRLLSWLDWLNILPLGLLLAGLQGLVALPVLLHWLGAWSWWIFFVGGALGTALLPGYAGWLAAVQTGVRREAAISGCLAGLLGFVLFNLVFLWWTYHQVPNHPRELAYPAMNIFLDVLLEGGLGVPLAIWGIAFGVSRGLRRSRSLLLAAEVERTASDEEV